MSVEFNEPSYQPSAGPRATAGKVSFLSRLVIGAGLAKDEKGAQGVLLVVLVISVLATGAILFFLMPESADTIPPIPEPIPVR